MKKTLQDQYLLIKEGKGHKDIFIKEAKQQFPGLIRNAATYTETANVLKTKNLINENIIGILENLKKGLKVKVGTQSVLRFGSEPFSDNKKVN